MHPIERLRMVARAAGDGPALVAQEAAGARVAFGDDPAGLVTACHRLVDRQPTSGPIWWLAARVLTAADPAQEAWQAVERLQDDTTAEQLSASLPDGVVLTAVGLGEHLGDGLARRGDVQVLLVETDMTDRSFLRRLHRLGNDVDDVPAGGLGAAVTESDLVIFEATAFGATGLVGPSGSRAAAAVGRHAGIPVWAVGGVGRALPGRLWDALAGRLDDDDEPWLAAEEVVPADLVDQVIGPRGPESLQQAVHLADCPIAPELLKGAE